MRVFIDNDVILDILLERKDFPYSAKIIQYIEEGRIIGLTSPIIFTNTFFLISKAKNKETAWNALRKLKLLFKITRINESIVDKALASGFKDFEDAIQYYCAIDSQVKYLVTRNKSDYSGDEIIIISPQEFLAIFEKN
ncbi:hypothetical protein A3J20_03920 [Candidatus Gottesmanbacteria bacterium RIFCSPLOWO2_02_FULL_42_29]|uniref:PIN domain-containing protein n=1 Tax=Candidatus Gottesmanbacteria bacterium RIFCSPLOWO2_01_FULL_42_22 TaxID=1798391 RepID=A0A1F6BI26_9BACT|nr:MAG: hypothetical protein A2781_03270 [Candidatus Gottesmanbacteria bacterium RIFCSPHIGHO2_01_FULL_42_27]OGG20058.1 MAG: hypothetical protein A3E72_02025 [Candidatus Gottesmanbacteria bacterium RIFCSPHIGHO2_12_FULL_43_26]OGG36177.1 MAG: hypothetical protein A2968_05700 [Candidatus Gottesmanbacteria bacterium RIFCSPLOWO2_01_FULL_42_22]OGG38263.1 MAG: hypothetical protein A3J20_03920 [Candidatus Gottesmanbacteria bacterium RIFCSPLOWO2_02_FULL_42_29]